jgi:Ca2+-binding RTX toxin-like protein
MSNLQMTPLELENYFLSLVNQERAAAGVKPLTFDGELLVSSNNHSVWMDQADTFSHTGANGSSAGDRMASAGYGWQSWGENIAYVSGDMNEATVRQLHTNLMNSQSHRENLLKDYHEEVGIGLHKGNIGGWDVIFVTQNFATPNATERAEPNDVGTTTTTSPAATTTSPTNTVTGQTVLGDGTSNTLSGTTGNDTLNGNGGADVLWGKSGSDTFVFDTTSEANGDIISDFVQGADKVNLLGIDANTRLHGDQAFKFIGTQGFHKSAGEVKAYQSDGDTYIAGDINGDRVADFTIKVLGAHTFANADFFL